MSVGRFVQAGIGRSLDPPQDRIDIDPAFAGRFFQIGLAECAELREILGVVVCLVEGVKALTEQDKSYMLLLMTTL